MKKFVVVTLLIAMVLTLTACGGGDRINLAQYNQVRTGMSRSEVRSILGSGGTQVSTTSLGGITTSIYSWQGRGSVGANALITFQDNQVISKAQVGLR